MVGSVAWQRYEAWNQALVSVLFTSANDGRPVYLDMDDDIFSRVAREVGVDPSNASAQLADAVRATLNLGDGDGPVFKQHLQNLRLWRRGPLKRVRDAGMLPEAPPIIGLLAALTLAAEEMQRDQSFSGNAYYPRLYQVLHVAEGKQQTKLHSAYQRDAEELWAGLNDWLSATDGRFGLPTAYALRHRYVGLPLSQALVRSADRRQFPLMFERYALPAGGEISPADMEHLIDSWLQMRPCPVSKSLESLWQRGQARERIAGVAAIELRSWDGTVTVHDPSGITKTGEVRLACWARRFPRPRFDISFLASFGAQASPQVLTVLTAPGRPEIEVNPVAGGRLLPVFTQKIDPTTLVEGVLQVEAKGTGLEASRLPRRLVTFRHDDLLNAYVECERVQLGEDCMLLVKGDEPFVGEVRDLLGRVARPGFRQEPETLPGLPKGWVAFADVQVVAVPEHESSRTDLNALVPLLSAQLAFAGGSRLPGQLRKWSSLNPPEIRAVVQGTSGLSVRLEAPHEGGEKLDLPRTWTVDGAALVVDLSELRLSDGDYEVFLLGQDDAVVQQATLRLRSSDTPDSTAWRTVIHLAHDVSDPLTVLRATAPGADTPADAVIRGPYTAMVRTPSVAVSAAPSRVWWTAPKPEVASSSPPIALAAIDPQSCVVTGAHYIQLPTVHGKAKGGTISGRCTKCGLVKRYPARFRRPREDYKHSGAEAAPLRVTIAELPPVLDYQVSGDVAFDSLVHVTGGDFHTFEYVTSQIEATALFSDVFARSLEARGDVEIERDSAFTFLRWEVSPAYLAELATGEFMLVGSWSRDDWEALRGHVLKGGGSVASKRDEYGLVQRLVANVDASELSRICELIGTAGVVRDAGARLAAVLPPLSELETALPRIPMSGASKIQGFHLKSASWVSSAFADKPGAYRLDRGFGRIYVFRTPADVEAGTAAVATAQLVKHLAARHFGHPLLAYTPSRKLLVVPLGADLPGLYGRAAVLCDGRLPKSYEKRRWLLYHGVTQRVADTLNSLLTS